MARQRDCSRVVAATHPSTAIAAVLAIIDCGQLGVRRAVSGLEFRD